MKRIAPVFAAALTALALAACNGATGSSAPAATTGPSAGATAATTAGPSAGTSAEAHNQADVTFAQSMIPHHKEAVAMAQLAPSRANSPEVKTLATEIQGAQDPEITTMTGWLTSWSQPTEMAGMDMTSMPGMMSATEMADLGKLSGAEFDRQFLTMMTKHHQGAVQMATTELSQGQYPAAKSLAQSIIKSQTAEIARMKTLLAQV
jgi:uncharacterized protein (DUF305 family)